MFYDHPFGFYVATAVALALFAVGIAGHVSLWRRARGRAWEGGLDRGVMVKALVLRVLLQRQLLKRSPLRWIMHMAIFWGFVLLFLESLWLMVLEWFLPREGAVFTYFESYSGQAILNFWGDFWGVVLLAGLVIALVRRYVLRTPQLNTMLDDAVAVWLLLAITLTGFAAAGVRVAAGEGLALDWAFAAQAFTWLEALGVADPMTLFWVHGLLSLALIAYIPYGKFMHIFAAPVEIPISAALYRERGETV